MPNTYVYHILLTMLLEGGYALVGNFTDSRTGQLWVSLEEVKEYLLFVRLRICPLTGVVPDLSKVTKADEDTRSLWAASMRSGLSLSEAMLCHKAEMNAFWMWACNSRAGDARRDIDADGFDNHDGDGNGGDWTPPPPSRPPMERGRGGKSQKVAQPGKGRGKSQKGEKRERPSADEPLASDQSTP